MPVYVLNVWGQYTDEEEEIVMNMEEDTTDIVPLVPMTWEEGFRFRLDSMLERHRTATVTVRTRVAGRRGRRKKRPAYTTTRKTITLRDRIGIAVWDLTADSMIYRRNSKDMFIPASNQKIFVAVAALDDLGVAYHFKTDVRTDLYFCRDSAEREFVRGNIYVHDRFDPTLDKEAADYIAKKLLGMDVDSIDGCVVSYLPLKGSMPYQEWFWNRHSSRNIVQNIVSLLKNDGVSFSSSVPYSTINSVRQGCGTACGGVCPGLCHTGWQWVVAWKQDCARGGFVGAEVCLQESQDISSVAGIIARGWYGRHAEQAYAQHAGA